MHVLHELVCGIRGAELGTVDIYRRGTSTRVTYYTSFEGDGSTTPTSATTLDANGGGEFYVNETVDVVVRDTGGVEVRRFTSAPAASAVEVISQSFTGTDYDSGATGASKPLALSAALDMLYPSFGARDFNVLVGGSSVTLQSALSGLATLYFNVKATTYGAVGDGVTNDATAIQAAVTAAQAAGGGIVFFPRGTYKINTTITVGSTVSLLGVGPAGSTITSASNIDLLTMSAGTTYTTSVEGLAFNYTSAITGSCVNVTASRLVRFENCLLDATNGLNAVTASTTGAGTAYFSRCKFITAPNGTCLVGGSANAQIYHVYGCKFVAPASPNNEVVRVYGGSVMASEFDVSGMSAGTLTLINFFAGASGLVHSGAVVSCSCGNPAGGTVTAVAQTTGRAKDGLLCIGNVWGSSVVHVSSLSDATAATYFGEQDFDRERGRYYVASDAAGVTIDAGQYANAEIVRSNTDVQTVTLGAAGAPGRNFTLVYTNNHGAGGGTITMAGPVQGLTTFTVNASCVSYYHFRSVHRQTFEFWILVGSSVNQAI